MARTTKEAWLAFVDTNIFLDFYRYEGRARLGALVGLEKRISSLIFTDQLRAEFLKHRLRTLDDVAKSIASSAPKSRGFPAIVEGASPSKQIENQTKSLIREYAKLEVSMNKIISDPENQDEVFKSINTFFQSTSGLVLKRGVAGADEILRRARERFERGHPPRKASDTSLGDAINWEWILHCASESTIRPNVIIVTRDKDYGIPERGLLNNWLMEEFSERVGRSQKVRLTDKVTDALPLLKERVSKLEVEREREVIAKKPRDVLGTTYYRNVFPMGKVAPPISAHNLPCGNCGSSGPWSGNRCLVCGAYDID